MLSSDIATAFAQAFVVGLAVIWLASRLLGGGSASEAEGAIPEAAGGVPLLGHALLYKADAPAFLHEQSARLGPIFRINLAGKRMVVVGADRAAIAQVTSAPEAVLSSRSAVQAIGFTEALGDYNVLCGTDFHKKVLKDWLSAGGLAAEVGPLHAEFDAALSLELSRALGGKREGEVRDLLSLVRRVVLRTMISRMLGFSAGEALLDEVMAFQDHLEDAIAKSSVLPRVLALPLALWPVQRRRARLCASIVTEFRRGRAALSGPWTEAFEAEAMPSAERAELVVGLLFAAHKNPAIGAAQAYLHGLERSGPELVAMRAEARQFAGAPTAATLAQCGALRRCALETCRVTAHSLGAVRTVLAPAGFTLRTSSGHTYRLRAGETLALAHASSNTDIATWGTDALVYDPRRAEWIDATAGGGAEAFASKGEVDEFKFTTFSQGIHKCPAEKLSLVVLQCVTACLLSEQAYRLEPVLPVPPVDFERATLAQRVAPVRMTVRACS